MTIKITQKYLRALNLFKFYIQEFRGFIRSSTITSDQILDYVGFSNKDIKEILQHTRYITEKEFSLMSEFFTNYYTLEEWLFSNFSGQNMNWSLIGLIEPSFSLQKHFTSEFIHNIQAISYFPNIIIDDDIRIEENDILIHHNKLEEKFFIHEIYYSSFSKTKPIYKLKVGRSKKNMQNTHNTLNINGNFYLNDSAKVNAGNITDNSIINITQYSPEVFEQTRKIIENINSNHRQELLDILSKIETAQKDNNKKDCGNWLGKFISLASVADCITVTQPIANILSWLLF